MAVRSQALKRGQRGQLALITALIAMPMSVAVVFAAELTALSGERSKMQAAVDAAALAGARDIGVSGGEERDIKGYTEQFAKELTNQTIPHVKTTFKAEQLADGAVRIDGVGTRNSFFGNMIPKGGFVIKVRAEGEALSKRPLCVVGTGSSDVKRAIDATEQSRILAPNCLIHSNADIELSDKAVIDAGSIQASGSAEGDGYSPEADEGALVLRDPFQSRVIKNKNSKCSDGIKNGVLQQRLEKKGVHKVPAGIKRWQYTATGTAEFRLAPGEHYFCQPLTIEQKGKLTGDNVVLIFENGALTATGDAKVTLTGRQTGNWAGFVFVSDRDNEADTILSSSFVDKLLGIIYLPNGDLFINAKGDVAEDSLWSVVIARNIALAGSSTLVINDNYEGSGVPVPKGVGNQTRSDEDGTRLRR
jgi:hypothetical protein